MKSSHIYIDLYVWHGERLYAKYERYQHTPRKNNLSKYQCLIIVACAPNRIVFFFRTGSHMIGCSFLLRGQTWTSLHRAPIHRCGRGDIHQRQRLCWRRRFHRQRSLRNARFFLVGSDILDILLFRLRPCPYASVEGPHPRLRRRWRASLWGRGVRGRWRTPLRRRAAGRATLLDALGRPSR